MVANWTERKKRLQEQHAEWKIANTKIIDQSGLPYTATDETMLFRNPGFAKADFYPSTGRWKALKEDNRIYDGGAEKFLKWYRRNKHT